MKHSRSRADIKRNMKYYFDDFNLTGLLPKRVDEFIPVLGKIRYYIPAEKNPHKKNKHIRQRFINNTFDNVSGFRPLRSIKKQIEFFKKINQGIVKPRNTPQPSQFDFNM